MSTSGEPSTPKNTELARSTLRFPVVGIGASAGGLKALLTLFEHMPADCGMAFVVIMHLSPKHESNADKILQNVIKMPVLQVTQSVPIERNHIYVIPPAMDLSMNDGYLRLLEPKRKRGPQVAVDLFFRALADVHHSHAIGIVLSGSGSDGSVGLSRIKEQGGVTLAQTPEDAEYDSMPRSAIETGMVDIVLPVAEIPQKLVELGHNLEALLAKQEPIASTGDTEQAGNAQGEVEHDHAHAQSKPNERALREILGALRARTGHDFRHYKQATVLRRIERRMQVNALRDMPSYARHLQSHPEETPALLADMLIGVTNFFRDREAFEALERDVIPTLFEEKESAGNKTLRVWSAACSTGEEAYSLAMLLADQAELSDSTRMSLQVFATDIDDRALDTARVGVYTEGIVTDVPPGRLRKYLVKEQNHFRMRKELRERILFARHNILRDPPFSRLDLISCRNLLIYLDRDIQLEVLRMFHFALNPGGFLFLGSSETADPCSQFFAPIDKKNRIYRAREVSSPLRRAPAGPFRGFALAAPARPSLSEPSRRSRKFSFADVHQRALEQYAPPSVIVNHEAEIVHMSDRAGNFLRYVGGEPSLNLTTLVHPQLRLELRTALYQATHTGKSVEARRVRLERDGRNYWVNMVVRPFRDDEAGSDYMLVLFDEVEACMDSNAKDADSRDSVLTQLEAELQQTKERLQATMEHSETSTEELRASNEELQAINEELRSATEELETSKEELQSINEELTTVNFELKTKVDETSKINDDLQNLISSTDIATVFVDRKMRIKWFTPRAKDIFNVIGNDAGRSLFDITHRLDYPQLHKDATQAFEELRLVEREISDQKRERWFLARLLPYRTLDDRIQGAVLTFIDITDRRRAEEELRAGEAHMKLLAQSTKGYAIITLDCDGTITTWNRGAEIIFGHREQEAIGRKVDLIYTEEDCRQGVPEAERKRALRQGQATDERWHVRKDGTRCFFSGLVNPLVDNDGKVTGFAKIARDLTEDKQRSTEQQSELESIQAANLQKDQFFAVLSHELKHPLNLVQLNTDLIARSQATKSSPSLRKAAQAIQNAVRSQSRIIDDLMDVSRIRTGKLKLQFSTLQYQDVLRGIEAVFAPLAQAENVTFEVFKPEQAVYVQADPTRLEQVIWNLLNNAWKFTKGGDRICMQLERDGEQARLDIIDTGEGISADFLPKVFDMFGQAEMQHAQRSKHGLGIGLALVKQLVEAHNGRIEAFSEGIGRGARFSVWLPIHLQTELELNDLANKGDIGGLAGIRILLVDDSPDILETMCELLESEGAHVTTADGGARGIDLAERMTFDVIVSDIGMPEIDGNKMMTAIREDGQNTDTPSIALTGYGTLRDVEKAKAAGFTLHLRKPIDLQALIDAVTQAVH
ncbi:PAS domain S-box protein [Stutzerimonas zhaodongensis]|uniref:histidine kinase n=1 Tax=Stutzerimonas zhaodongensis TaxID=1176257 RepID=A0A3M2HL68_9GAMM|nr:CheR family methyltransferase [Stutzerimonas zhaodongensis]MCQ4318352.1 PAS domain-containing protein [Stutzerimonas zhaodongensis]RMH90461.1 PAS domain S-box protein [Stutzerimonas zhaodongensis]